MSKLKENYKKACTDYIDVFCKQQGFEFENWVGDIIGEIAVCGDMYFNFNDIVHHIDTNQPKGLIIDWYYDCVDNEAQTINYRSYCMGLRFINNKK